MNSFQITTHSKETRHLVLNDYVMYNSLLQVVLKPQIFLERNILKMSTKLIFIKFLYVT